MLSCGQYLIKLLSLNENLPQGCEKKSYRIFKIKIRFQNWWEHKSKIENVYTVIKLNIPLQKQQI